jgi:tetratricopeptide (TPR) repeat protein
MKSFRETLALNLILILSLILLPAYALAKGSIDVQCVDNTGKPLAGAKVLITNIENRANKDKKSDANGLARFEKIDDGVYRVLSRVNGFLPALYEFVALQGDKQETVKLQFAPGADKQLYFENQEIMKQAEEAFQGAATDLQANKFADAENKLKVAIDMYPSNPQMLIYMGIAQLQQKKWAEGKASLEAADRISAALMQLKPPQGQTTSGFAPVNQQAKDLLAKITVLALRSDAGDNLQKKNYKQAIALFQESLKYAPDDADTYYNIALAQANEKSFAEAEKSIEKAHSLKPTESAYQDLAKQIADLKQNDLLKQAQVTIDEGQALSKNGDHAGALKKFEQAEVGVPTKGQAMIETLIAKEHAQMNQPDQAIQSFKKAMELDPDNADYKNALAQYYASLKRYDEALAMFAGPTATDDTILKLGQKMTQGANAQPEFARIAFEKVIQMNANNAEAYYELGMALYYGGKENDKRAKEMFTKYVGIGKEPGHLDNAKNFLVVIERRSK